MRMKVVSQPTFVFHRSLASMFSPSRWISDMMKSTFFSSKTGWQWNTIRKKLPKPLDLSGWKIMKNVSTVRLRKRVKGFGRENSGYLIGHHQTSFLHHFLFDHGSDFVLLGLPLIFWNLTWKKNEFFFNQNFNFTKRHCKIFSKWWEGKVLSHTFEFLQAGWSVDKVNVDARGLHDHLEIGMTVDLVLQKPRHSVGACRYGH